MKRKKQTKGLRAQTAATALDQKRPSLKKLVFALIGLVRFKTLRNGPGSQLEWISDPALINVKTLNVGDSEGLQRVVGGILATSLRKRRKNG